MVGHLGGDQQLAATSIVFATLASVVSLPLSLMITQPQSWQAILDWFDGFMAKI
jgi:predicted permease